MIRRRGTGGVVAVTPPPPHHPTTRSASRPIAARSAASPSAGPPRSPAATARSNSRGARWSGLTVCSTRRAARRSNSDRRPGSRSANRGRWCRFAPAAWRSSTKLPRWTAACRGPTARSIRPRASAWAALSLRPVRSRSSAVFRPTSRGRWIVPPQHGTAPCFRWGKPSRVVGPPTAKRQSHANANSSAPFRHGPSIKATVTAGSAASRRATLCPSRARAAASVGSRRAANSARSAPTPNPALPLRSTSTSRVGWAWATWRAAWRSARTARVRTLRSPPATSRVSVATRYSAASRTWGDS
jgi:hypothetical protein